MLYFLYYNAIYVVQGGSCSLSYSRHVEQHECFYWLSEVEANGSTESQIVKSTILWAHRKALRINDLCFKVGLRDNIAKCLIDYL